ncbi:MAG TPA: hypothetical protein VGS27_07605 [Candidatus Sulfotelmatobacter sp.]|nr:hypothetical protein [Candidatus Sulfotelmatobacter sp.]
MIEQRIKELCARLVSSSDPAEIEEIGEQLRSAIHEHVETLRQRLPIAEALESSYS